MSIIEMIQGNTNEEIKKLRPVIGIIADQAEEDPYELTITILLCLIGRLHEKYEPDKPFKHVLRELSEFLGDRYGISGVE